MNFHEKYQLLCECKTHSLIINVKPRPSDRPRAAYKGRGITMPNEYKQAKEDYIEAIKKAGGIPDWNWIGFHANYYIKYPKGEMTKEWAKDGILYRSMGDTDNFHKTLMDAMQDGGYITDDRMLLAPDGMRYRTRGESFISVTLFALPDHKVEKFEPLLKLIREDYESKYKRSPIISEPDDSSDPLGIFSL